MFKSGQKKSPAKRTWAVQVLTRDYVIEGVLQPRVDDTNEYFSTLVRLLKQDASEGLNLPLVSARMQPTGNLAAAPRSFGEWNLRLGPNVVAFAPLDDDGLSTLRQAFDHFKFPFPATLYAGGYQVQATLLADSQLGWSSLRSFIPLVDAQIDCLLPGARLTGWRSPWLLLNGALVQGDARQPQ